MGHKVTLTRADSLIIVALALGLLVSLFILTKPYPAGPTGLPASVNVVATAQALQTRRQQAELETAHQAQKAVWAAELAKKRQELLAANQQGQTQIARLQAQLDDLQTQINQSQANAQAMSQKVSELEQAIQTDEAAYQNQLAALKADLAQAHPQPTSEPAALSTNSLTGVDQPASSTIVSPAPADMVDAPHKSEDDSSTQHDDHQQDEASSSESDDHAED